MAIVIIFLSLVCTLIDLFRRRIMTERPVTDILNATKKIASGDFSVRLTTLHSVDDYDDFDLIKENLNAMAVELDKSEILKTDFISNVSHEIKTPLSVIRNYVGLIKDERDEQERKKYAKIIVSATERLSSLVTNVLLLNKLENQSLNYSPTEIPLHEQLAQAVLLFEDEIDKKEINLEYKVDDCYITSFSQGLEIVWSNLISNAVKFTNQGGTITIKAKKRGDIVTVSVSDDGCGMDAETGARIFDKFYQGDTSHGAKGNGLGLALVKKVIDLIGGKITVKSQKDKGSTFTVEIKDERA